MTGCARRVQSGPRGNDTSHRRLAEPRSAADGWKPIRVEPFGRQLAIVVEHAHVAPEVKATDNAGLRGST